MFEIIHCKAPGLTNPEAIDFVHDYCMRKITPECEPLWRNYQPDELDIEGHLIFSFMLHEKKLAAMCGIYNGGRYPERVYRVLNRKYIDPEFRRRSFTTPRNRWRSFAMADEQIRLVKKEISLAFVSNEKLRRKKSLPVVASQLKSIETPWTLEDDLVKTSLGDQQSAYQLAIWTSPDQSFSQLPLQKISVEEYSARYL